MQTHLGHMQLNVQAANVSFYKELLTFVGWQTIIEDDGFLGMADERGVSLWFVGHAKAVDNDYDGPGVNHLAISVASQADVNTVAAYLTERNVAPLFETPRHRPDFSADPERTYYQVMFESPDRILFEVVYIGAKDT